LATITVNPALIDIFNNSTKGWNDPYAHLDRVVSARVNADMLKKVMEEELGVKLD